MIKKLLYIFAIIATCTFSSKAQSTFLVTPTDTLRMDTTVANCQTETVMIFNLSNTSSTDSLFKWKIVYNTFPHAWALGFCDPQRCLTTLPTSAVGYILGPHGNGTMQLDLTPSSGSACGNFKVLTWDINDSANTATYLNFKACVTANCTNGIAETDIQQVSLYPNPVRNELKLSLPQNLANGQIDIYDLIGSKVFSQPISSRETAKDFDLSTLEKGIYVARISDGGKIIATKKFTKTN